VVRLGWWLRLLGWLRERLGRVRRWGLLPVLLQGRVRVLLPLVRVLLRQERARRRRVQVLGHLRRARVLVHRLWQLRALVRALVRAPVHRRRRLLLLRVRV